jgi:hypothetical protein
MDGPVAEMQLCALPAQASPVLLVNFCFSLSKNPFTGRVFYSSPDVPPELTPDLYT